MNIIRLKELKDRLIKDNPSNLNMEVYVKEDCEVCLMGLLPKYFPDTFVYCGGNSICFKSEPESSVSCIHTQIFFDLNNDEFYHIFERGTYQDFNCQSVDSVVQHIDDVLNGNK